MGRQEGAPGERPLLDVADLSVRFGGIVALDGLSFRVHRGEIAGIIGPNGAGKTTLFNCLSRLYRADGGRIEFDGRPLMRARAHQVAALGVGRTFQNLALFHSLSVFENVLLGRHCHGRGGFLANALRLPRVARHEALARARARELLGFLALEPVADLPVAALTFGMRKRVELGRALAAEPKLLLLDEPASGLNHEEVDALGALIRAIRDRIGVTVLLVEHHMRLLMSVSDHVVALDFGRKIADGSPDEVRGHPEVVRAYLGTAA
jgi:branched-chain amino acid transport system ATP-binding protein